MLLSMAALAVSARAQETVGGLVCGQTYDYVRQQRPRLLVLLQVLRRRLLRKTHLVLLRELMDGVILLTISVQTGIPFRILHCPA